MLDLEYHLLHKYLMLLLFNVFGYCLISVGFACFLRVLYGVLGLVQILNKSTHTHATKKTHKKCSRKGMSKKNATGRLRLANMA